MRFPEGREKKKIKLVVNSISNFSFKSCKMSTFSFLSAKKGFKKFKYLQPL